MVQNFARFGSPKIELRGRDFSFDPRAMDLRPESGGGQFGLAFDDTGRRFVCSNSRHLMQIMTEDRIAARVTDYPLPAPAVDIADDGPQAEVFRRSPDEAWRVIRTQWRVSGAVKGLIEGGGRASGYFTSASGVTIYRGDAWPAEFRGDVFIADCGSNLIHHKKLRGPLVQHGTRAPEEARSEFLASTDNWFRPVAFANAPDGTLWFADMYREVIEHPWSLPESLKQHLDLSSGDDRGRLYRLVHESSKPRLAPKLGDASTAELVTLLAHPNGWHRDTAARLLHQRQDKSATPALVALAEKADAPVSRILTLAVLRGLDALDAETIKRALHDTDSDVRTNAVRLCALTNTNADTLVPLVADPSPRVRAEVAWALVTFAPVNKLDLLATLLDRADEPWLRHSALAAAGDAIEAVLTKLTERQSPRVAEIRQLLSAKPVASSALPALAPAGSRAEAIVQFRPALRLTGDAGKGRATFDARCALCHRLAGRGNAVGPDLDAARLGGREKLLGNILEPSREITAGYALGIVTTKNGDTFSGILANETPAGVALRLPGGQERIVRRAEIEKIEHSPRSLMPDGLEAGLTPQNMADLLEHLSTTSASH
jgi:putative heme-binding domain-containing protein